MILHCIDGSSIDVSGERLENVIVDELNLHRVLLDKEIILKCIFSAVDFRGAFITSSVITGCRFRQSSFITAHFEAATITNSLWDKCDLRFAMFNNASLTQVVFSSCNLEGIDLNEARITQADFQSSIGLEKASMIGLTYDIHTKWPAYFDPHQYGAKLVEA